jgi:hypothetical protein
MENGTKNAASENVGEVKPVFLQAEPDEINEADLQNIAGGAACTNSQPPVEDVKANQKV